MKPISLLFSLFVVLPVHAKEPIRPAAAPWKEDFRKLAPHWKSNLGT
jgi:hypothetical protein